MALVKQAARSSAELHRPIFVVGSPRSGTTLVQCILSASPCTFSLPETHFFSIIRPSLGLAIEDRIQPDQLERIRALLQQEAHLTFDDTTWAVPRGLWERGDVSMKQLFVWLIDAHRPADDTRRQLRAVEKTPLHVLHAEQISEAFPTAKLVNVVRHPADVVSSWMAAPFATSRAVLGYAQAWVQAIESAESYAKLHSDRIRTIQHERLVKEPERSVREVCEFLDLPYDNRMLLEFGQEATRNVARQETWKDDVQKGVLLNREGVWRGRISPGQAWLVARATRAQRLRYGYPAGVEISPKSIASALLREVSERFKEGCTVMNTFGAARHAIAALKILGEAGSPRK